MTPIIFALSAVAVIFGTPTVIDGDTIKVSGTTIRLNGIAAPEMSDPGGAAARQALIAITQGKSVSCKPDGTYTHGRTVAICTADGADIAETLIRDGYARDCARYSGGRYAIAEAKAAEDGSQIAHIYPLPGYCRD